MRYVAGVVAVFPEGTAYPDTFDAWHAIVFLDGENNRDTLHQAVSKARSVFENRENLGLLGYSTKPVLYNVAWTSRHHELENSKPSDFSCGVVITDMLSLTARDVQELRAKRDISVPLHALYVVQP